jgi:WS/DGAT/MGAT family acyltransferase
MLDRSKPLWEMYIVNGLEGDRSAAISKVHHCLVDGVSGIELFMIVMDVSRDPPPAAPPEEPFQPPALPGETDLFFSALWDNMADGLDRWADYQKSLVDLAIQPDPLTVRRLTRAVETAAPYFATPVQKAPFNKPFSGDRDLACSEFSFQEIRAIKAAVGGTVNDVVLAILGAALTRYLEMHGEPTEGRELRILTPVNVRHDDERANLGNRISMLLVEVPAGVGDPVERVRVVTQRTARLKRDHVAAGMEMLSQLIGQGPPLLQSLIGAMPDPPNTLANMVCTNVPGPMIPLYSVGHRLIANYPLMPIAWDMGIGCGVTSYDQTLYFGLMADAGAASDVRRLKEFLDQAYVELRNAAGVAKSDLPQMGKEVAIKEERPRRAAPSGEALAADAG